MSRVTIKHNNALLLTCAWIVVVLFTTCRPSIAAAPSFQMRLDSGHPWRPPFGLDRVGRRVEVIVESSENPGTVRCTLTALSKGKEIQRAAVHFPGAAPYTVRVAIEGCPDELLLSGVAKPGEKPIELARQSVRVPELEADAIAVPDTVKNPVDLGTILVPSGWLLLGPDQRAFSSSPRSAGRATCREPSSKIGSSPCRRRWRRRRFHFVKECGRSSISSCR